MKLLPIAAFAMSLATVPAFAQQANPGAHFLENWDLNEDGQVTLAEATERRSDVFASFDSNDDAVLSAEEYDLFDEARANDMRENGMRQGKRSNSPANGMLRQFTDLDGDGQVTQAEFINSVPDWYAKIDRNGDGTVTREDFGRRGS